MDPGAMVSVISIKKLRELQNTENSELVVCPLTQKVRAANNSIMKVYGFCDLTVTIQALLVTIRAMVCDLSCEAILGMDIMASHLQGFPYELNMRDGLLTGPKEITVVLHRRKYIGRKISTKSTIQGNVKPEDNATSSRRQVHRQEDQWNSDHAKPSGDPSRVVKTPGGGRRTLTDRKESHPGQPQPGNICLLECLDLPIERQKVFDILTQDCKSRT